MHVAFVDCDAVQWLTGRADTEPPVEEKVWLRGARPYPGFGMCRRELTTGLTNQSIDMILLLISVSRGGWFSVLVQSHTDAQRSLARSHRYRFKNLPGAAHRSHRSHRKWLITVEPDFPLPSRPFAINVNLALSNSFAIPLVYDGMIKRKKKLISRYNCIDERLYASRDSRNRLYCKYIIPWSLIAFRFHRTT